jgi:uncharacterized protein (TIGR00297 family)
MAPSQSVLISAVVALLGWRLRALTAAGAVVALLVGTAILARTGWPGLAALGAFFAGSSLVSRLSPDRAQQRFDAKGNQRDVAQVLANGGAAAVGALLLPAEPALWLVSASLAAAAADTWATSFGGWSRTDPSFILSGRRVPAGTSGGVTLMGSAGGLAGSLTVAVSAALIAGGWLLLASCTIIGFAGMILDSLLGATLQARFYCPGCDQPTERSRHRCGASARLTGGVSWVSNDVVNGGATLAAALLGLLAWHWLHP